MSVYTALLTGAQASMEARELAGELSRWHDAMVLHQRHVRREGAGAACSTECPHAVAGRLWREARRLLGPMADRLEFLRACAEGPALPVADPHLPPDADAQPRSRLSTR